jgi:protocatechuate 3,4-dioxygenase beta subunit
VKRVTVALTLAAMLALAVVASAEPEKRNRGDQQLKNVTGQVLDRSDHPLENAIVYLQDSRTMAVKTFITDGTGAYRFHGLNPNTDYQVHAEYKGQKSDTKTVSAFDSRTNLTLHLRIK